VVVESRPERAMGSSFHMVVVTESGQEARAQALFDKAQAELATLDRRLSIHLNEGELAQVNRAAAGTVVPVSTDTLKIVAEARAATERTGGAFNATALPLFKLWRQTANEDRRPTAVEIAEAQALVGWQLFTIANGGVTKNHDLAGIDLGGIAKGVAVDRVTAILAKSKAQAGLVQLGGETRVFGPGPNTDGSWSVSVPSPFGANAVAELRLRDHAVSTSGNYHRFLTIGGEQVSHIINPITGTPAFKVPLVTVVAYDAEEADLWSTALGVLGKEGLTRIPHGVEALLVLGEPNAAQLVTTPGMQAFLAAPARL